MVLRTLHLTHVVYEDTPIDKALALCTFLPFAVLGALGALTLVNRCCESAFALTGLLVSTTINLILKHWIQQPRPAGSARGDYGMPSDHSQFMAFLAVYLVGWLFLSRRVPRHSVVGKMIVCVSATALAPVVMYSRVRIGVHSVEQVLVGGCIGVALGSLWHLLGNSWIRPCVFPWFARSALGRWLRIKDSGATPDVQLVESEIALILSSLARATEGSSGGAVESTQHSAESSALVSARLASALDIDPKLLRSVGIDERAWSSIVQVLESGGNESHLAWRAAALAFVAVRALESRKTQ